MRSWNAPVCRLAAVTGSPPELSITFTEGVEPLFSTIAVDGASGAAIATGKPHVASDSNCRQAPTPQLARDLGQYPQDPGQLQIHRRTLILGLERERAMRTLLAAILIAMPFGAFADEAGIQIDHAWARAAPAGHEGVIYLTVTDGGAPDTLAGVTTPVAAEAAVHQSIDAHGICLRGVFDAQTYQVLRAARVRLAGWR